jgi:hypothetical protein
LATDEISGRAVIGFSGGILVLKKFFIAAVNCFILEHEFAPADLLKQAIII